jgi:ribosomal protein S18 acetylase RimI-like enzyme
MTPSNLHIEHVPLKKRDHFLQMAKCYWHEIMPQSAILKSQEAIQAYFIDTFTWNNGNKHPYWALCNTEPVGFISIELEHDSNTTDSKQAYVHDFYIASRHRRKGYGAKLVHWLFSHLDPLGIERLDLNVRRDNPNALAFWQAQGFGIAGYSMRMYRNPHIGTAYKGVLSSDFVNEE